VAFKSKSYITILELLKIEINLQQKTGQFINQIFAEPMRVMFLPEKIVPVKVGLAESKSQLRLTSVTETLA
jgi:hypothetical protein